MFVGKLKFDMLVYGRNETDEEETIFFSSDLHNEFYYWIVLTNF